MTIQERFGKNLLKQRQVTGLSQEKFALKVGLDRTYISSMERGKRNVSIGTLDQLSKALKVPIEDLIK